MADTKVSKTFGDYTPCGFDSRSRHTSASSVFFTEIGEEYAGGEACPEHVEGTPAPGTNN